MTFWGEFKRWWREITPSPALLGWTAGFVSTLVAIFVLVAGIALLLGLVFG